MLFQIRNYTYVEIRDCSIISKNKDAVMDAAFLMNEKDLVAIAPTIEVLAANQSYRGILSVKSCTLQNFSYGFMTGSNSILSIELSSISDSRQVGILCVNPKILKITGTMFDNQSETHAKIGIQLLFKDSPANKILKKVLIEENRIVNCKETGLQISALDTSSGSCVDSIAAVKIQKNRIYSNYQGVTVKNVSFHEFELTISDLSHNTISNLEFKNVKISDKAVANGS